ncbi:transposase, partial [Cupriavidus metallidurans]|uniref:transposase n=1 Tax=Cupriavidus metallidurans TaxID=119219 RepID=UPI001F20CFDE
MTSKTKRAQYTLEFKLEAVRLVKSGQSMAVVSATLGIRAQTLHNWVKAERERVPAFGSLAALNDWLADQCVRLWQQTRHPELDMTIWEAWSL